MGDFPLMTEQGTFIINGAERVVVSQLVRSPGVYYTGAEDPATGRDPVQRQGHPEPRRLARVRDRARGPAVRQGRPQAQAPRRPSCCAPWATRTTTRWLDLLAVIDHRRDPVHRRDPRQGQHADTQDEALIEVYKKLRPGDPPTGDNAEKLVESLFFNFRRYDLGRVGRYKLNKKLAPSPSRMGIEPPTERTISKRRTSRRSSAT